MDASFCSSSLSAGMGAICRTKTGLWIEGIRGKVVANDSNLAELTAIKVALDWVKERKWPNCIMLSDSAIVVDNVMGITRIRNRYTNITSICRESMKEGCVMWVQKMEKDQVSKADALAKTVKKEDPQYHDFLHFSTSPWKDLNLTNLNISFEQLPIVCNIRAQKPLNCGTYFLNSSLSMVST